MKLKKPTSKVLGELTGKLVAGAVALPGKTSETTGSIKAEFLAGYKSANGSTKVKGSEPVDVLDSEIVDVSDPFSVFNTNK